MHGGHCGAVKCLCFCEQCNSTPSCAQTALWRVEAPLFFPPCAQTTLWCTEASLSCQQGNLFLPVHGGHCGAVKCLCFVSNVTLLLSVYGGHCGAVNCLRSCQQCNSAQTSINGGCRRVFKYNLFVPCMDYC